MLAHAWKLGDYIQAKKFKDYAFCALQHALGGDDHSLEDNPLLALSDEWTKDLDVKSPLFRLFAAALGDDLYATGDPKTAAEIIRSLGVEARAAVSKYMFMRGFKMGKATARSGFMESHELWSVDNLMRFFEEADECGGQVDTGEYRGLW